MTRVISVCPAGRRRYIEVLAPYLLQNRDVIERHHWWVNTQNPDDVACLEELAAAHPDFFHLCYGDYDDSMSIGANIWRFFKHHAEPGTVYVRLDDDIVWVDRDAVRTLVEFRLANPDPFLVFGNIVNNAVCTHFHQQAGLIPRSWGHVNKDAHDPVGWVRGSFAQRVHRRFLRDIETGRTELWKQVALPIRGTQTCSINFIAWKGEDMAAVPELHTDPMEEEAHLTTSLPTQMGRPNAACPEALVAHYAFYPQRAYIERAAKDILPRYRKIAEAGGQPTPKTRLWTHGLQDAAASTLTTAKWGLYALERDARRTVQDLAGNNKANTKKAA